MKATQVFRFVLALTVLPHVAAQSFFSTILANALASLVALFANLDFSSLNFGPIFNTLTFLDFSFPETEGPLEVIGEKFEEFLLLRVNQAISCSGSKPTFDSIENFNDGVEVLFNLVFHNTCDADILSPEQFIQQKFGGPILGLFEKLLSLGAKSRQLENETRDLQTSDANLKCAKRFSEGDYDGLLERAQDLPDSRTGGTNQYAWGIDFNDDLGYGIVIHSTGSPGALIGQYSLPTFTIRDAKAEIVFEGVLKSPLIGGKNAEPFNVGLRSAAVTAVETKKDETIITVVASTVSIPNGEFLEFKFNLQDYIANNREPLEGLQPTRRADFVSPSVRALQLINPETILYAPNFDVSGADEVGFLQLFSLKSFKNVGDKIFVGDDSDNNNRLNGIIWDFECGLSDLASSGNSACFINFIAIDFGVSFLALDETTVPTTSYFELKEVLALAESPPKDPIVLPSTIVDNTFNIEYSAQVFEPLLDDVSLVCTLSGFLFRGGSITNNPDAKVPSFRVLASLADIDGILKFFELGEPQQCEVCRAALPAASERRGLTQTTNLAEDQCRPVSIANQPDTTAYIWAAEECGGRVYIGTYDFGSVLSENLLDILIGAVSISACGNDNTVDLACSIEGAGCGEDPVRNREICENVLAKEINDFLPSEFRIDANIFLQDAIFGTESSPNDLGFDLYVADVDDVLNNKGGFVPITQNGFRELAPARFEKDPAFVSKFGFEPSSQKDEGIRNLACHKDPVSGEETLVVGSVTFQAGAFSNTYVVDTGCINDILDK